ncbi:MAG: hybrid sensor histidine kinase/response regulator [Gallionellaceae bacterium]
MTNSSTIWGEIHFHINEGNLRIRADQIKSRLQLFPIMVGSQFLLEPLLVGLLWNKTSNQGLLAWLIVLVALHCIEMWSWWKHRTAVDTVAQCRQWSLRFKIFAAAVGMMWGLAAVYFFPTDLAYQALILCVILGLSAGAVTMNPVYPPALYIFLSSILIPTILRVTYEGDSLHWILSGMLVLFSLVIINSGRELSRTFYLSLVHRYENLSLVQQLTQEKLRAETANSDKSRFLASASHDLRQPLQALMLFSDALQDKAQEKEVKHLAGQIGKSVNALVEMFDELLDVSKLEAGIVEVRWQNFALQPLLDRLYVDLAPLAQAKALNFEMPSCDDIVYSDSFLLDRILRNLISNAIRYTDLGTVAVQISAHENKFRFSVMDTGVGISPEALPHIFEEYFQIDNQHRDRRKGLGLGLSIVRRVEGLLGCKIEVASQLGKGSMFSFEIQSGDAEKLAQPFVMTHSRHDLRGVVVALVEDDLDIRQMLVESMEEWGCRVFAAEQSSEVMRMLDIAEMSPDLLVCDYRLPNGETAVHVIKRLRESWGGGVPALILTGDTAPEALRHINATGAMLLHKPIAPSRLRTMMYFSLHGES